MCQILQSSNGQWDYALWDKYPFASDNPVPWKWIFVQDERIKECKPCKTSIPASTPHTIPAYASAEAGKSVPFAGAPNYIYYIEQIPEGMLDPNLRFKPWQRWRE
jgi:hypothetical protein